MPTVATVRGPVDVADLGPTLMHEHIFVLSTEYIQNSHWWDEEARVTDAISRLRSLAAKGIRTFVDPTVFGLGRYIPRIQRIAAEVPELQIIVATGCYSYHDVPFQYRLRGPGTMFDEGGPDPMALDFLRDLTVGIADTGVRAAFLKCAVDEDSVSEGALVPPVARILRAVAHAHRETGAPITVHTHPGAGTGRLALSLFRSEGVNLTKVVVGHSGDSNDLAYLTELADSGAILGMDRFGIDLYNPTPSRVATIAALCARGYADRMVLGQDASCFMDWFAERWDDVSAIAPNWHYEHISNDVLPALRETGVSDKDIDLMLIDNPRRYFTP